MCQVQRQLACICLATPLVQIWKGWLAPWALQWQVLLTSAGREFACREPFVASHGGGGGNVPREGTICQGHECDQTWEIFCLLGSCFASTFTESGWGQLNFLVERKNCRRKTYMHF